MQFIKNNRILTSESYQLTGTLYLTVSGTQHYYGTHPLEIGTIVKCFKEPENSYDAEAIMVWLPVLGTVGYVANSARTVIRGTMSAGRLYDRIGEVFYARVLFVSGQSAICQVEGDKIAW